MEARQANVGKSLWLPSTTVVAFQQIGNLAIDLGIYCEPVVVGITQLHCKLGAIREQGRYADVQEAK